MHLTNSVLKVKNEKNYGKNNCDSNSKSTEISFSHVFAESIARKRFYFFM